MDYTGERAIPWRREVGLHVLHPHVMRYAWALPFVWGKKVVDLGCGAGYGTFMLSWAARRAIGVDVSEEAIAFAALHFQAENLEYAVLDVTRRGYNAEVYVAFEVLEHLDEPARVIERCRPLVWSMPIGDGSRFHKRSYSLDEIDALTGGAQWLQAADHAILLREQAGIAPTHALGVIV